MDRTYKIEETSINDRAQALAAKITADRTPENYSLIAEGLIILLHRIDASLVPRIEVQDRRDGAYLVIHETLVTDPLLSDDGKTVDPDGDLASAFDYFGLLVTDFTAFGTRSVIKRFAKKGI